MYWVLQSGYEHERGIGELIAFLERAEIPHSLHKVVPFVQEIEPDINPQGDVVVFGTYGMRHLAKRKGWVPGSFDLAEVTYADHVVHWGEHMLNSDAIYCKFEDAPEFLGREPRFMRPVVDSKFFSGKVTTREEFMPWHHRVVDLKEDSGHQLAGDTMVLIAKVKSIWAEYRVWIVDGEVVTASLYKRGGRALFLHAGVDAHISAFAADRAREWAPARAYVMDVACTNSANAPGEDLFIVETNTFNSAGLYAADVCKLVGAIEAMRF